MSSIRVYVESACLQQPRVLRYLNQHPNTHVIECTHYKEVFNPKATQNFRLQKRRPAMIIAKKQGTRVHPTPESFGIGSNSNFYFSHLLNCPFDCRYCFLQGMYASANFVWFVNYEDFMEDIQVLIHKHTAPYFFSGYDGDSLALDNQTHFLDEFLPFFAKNPKATLELRSKSTQISRLLAHQAMPNVVCAFSVAPQVVVEQLEHRCASLAQRIKAMCQCAENGWFIGLRFDPLIYFDNFAKENAQLVAAILEQVPAEQIHSISVGPLRFPKAYFKTIKNLYPDEPLLAQHFSVQGNTVSYVKAQEEQLVASVLTPLSEHGIDNNKLFRCYA